MLSERVARLVETHQQVTDGYGARDQDHAALASIVPNANTVGECSAGEQSPQVFLGLEKLICAALADSVFAAALIASPIEALAGSAHNTLLTENERVLVCSVIGASDIHDYAARLHAITYPHQPNGFG
ncbi:MAG: hypothetical protein JOZ51_14285 [Chloroflexi bacterium]|nr:hypothetical protein [Chloroflexota bacterium]